MSADGAGMRRKGFAKLVNVVTSVAVTHFTYGVDPWAETFHSSHNLAFSSSGVSLVNCPRPVHGSFGSLGP
jgi:hypothetical protein